MRKICPIFRSHQSPITMRKTLSISMFCETRIVWQILRCQQSTVSMQNENTVVITIHHGTRKVWQIFIRPRQSKVARRNTASLDHRSTWNPDSKTDFWNSPSLIKKNPERKTDFQTWTVASNHAKNSCNHSLTWNPENMADSQKSPVTYHNEKNNLDHHVLWNPESMTDSKMSTVDSFSAKHSRDNHSSRNPESMADFHKSSTVESGKKKHSQSRSPINM